METPEPGGHADGGAADALNAADAPIKSGEPSPSTEPEDGAELEAGSAPSTPTLYPPLPDHLVRQLRQMAKLVEQIARRVLEIETAHRATVGRVIELETAVSVQRVTLQGMTQVLDGHRSAIGALGKRHNEQEHAIVAVRADVVEQQQDIQALHGLVTQDFLASAVDSLEP